MMKLDGMGHGFFIPIFFILVGSKIDLAVFRESGELIIFLVILLGLLFAIKVIPSMIWVRVFGWRNALSGGFLMASRLSLIIAASQVGLNLKVITPAMNTSFVILAVLTCIISPLIFNKMNRRQDGEEEKVIIVGGGGTGVFLANNLKMHNREVVIIDLKKEKIDALVGKGIRAIHGNATNPDIFKEVDLRPKDYIVILTHTEERNVNIASILKDKLNHANILTITSKKSELEKLDKFGIEPLDGAQVVATAIENLIFRPDTYHTIFESFESFNVEIIKLTNKKIIGHQIKEIPFHQEGFLMMVKREGEYFVPHGDDYLQNGDEVVAFGRHSALLDYKAKLTQ